MNINNKKYTLNRIRPTKEWLEKNYLDICEGELFPGFLFYTEDILYCRKLKQQNDRDQKLNEILGL